MRLSSPAIDWNFPQLADGSEGKGVLRLCEQGCFTSERGPSLPVATGTYFPRAHTEIYFRSS